jgi:hypothetical protein
VWWLHFRPFISLRTASKTTVGTLLCGKVKKSSYSKLLAERSNFSFQGFGVGAEMRVHKEQGIGHRPA